DHTDDATPVPKRDGEQRLLDGVGALDQLAELAIRGVAHHDRLAEFRAASRDPEADAGAEEVEREGLRRRGQLAEERDRDALFAVGDEDPAVVVIDERP